MTSFLRFAQSESPQYRHGISSINVNMFIWTNNKEPEIYCVYTMQVPKGEVLKADFPATLNYIKNGMSVKVNLKAANVTVN
ncbi:MAG: hypothetical protein JST26_08165 [Bacteroidetes bacterium]|nr:hypothetical protein [Bacteroidota bacterium]